MRGSVIFLIFKFKKGCVMFILKRNIFHCFGYHAEISYNYNTNIEPQFYVNKKRLGSLYIHKNTNSIYDYSLVLKISDIQI